MKLQDKEIIIAQTRKWIIDVVIGCNFCPFAAREVKRGTICYEVVEKGTIRFVLEALAAEPLYLHH